MSQPIYNGRNMQYGIIMRNCVLALNLEPELYQVLRRTCDAQGLHLLHLTWQDFLRSELSIDRTTSQSSTRLCFTNGVDVEVDSIALLLCFDRCVPTELVQKLSQEQDKAYIFSTWQGVWLWINQVAKVAMNRVHHTMLQANYLSLPHTYYLAKRVGLTVPNWHFSSQKLHDPHMLRTGNLSVRDNHNFSKSNDCGYLAVEYMDAKPVLLLCIRAQILSTDPQQHVAVAVPVDVMQKLRALRVQLRCEIIEVLFKVRAGQWFLQRVSTKPEWQRWWSRHLTWCVDYMLKQAITCTQMPCRTKKIKPFIDVSLRPLDTKSEPSS